MGNKVLSIANVILLCAATAGHAAIQNEKNEFLPEVNSDVDSFAQNNTDNFVVLREDILLVQQALIKLGYDVGKVDGIAHNRTINAIVELQRKEGLAVTGEIDPQLLNFLGIR